MTKRSVWRECHHHTGVSMLRTGVRMVGLRSNKNCWYDSPSGVNQPSSMATTAIARPRNTTMLQTLYPNVACDGLPRVLTFLDTRHRYRSNNSNVHCAQACAARRRNARLARHPVIAYPKLGNVCVGYHLWLGFLELKAFLIGLGCIHHRWLENRWCWCAVGIHVVSRWQCVD